METKKVIRQRFVEKRNELSKEERRKAERKIAECLYTLEAYKTADTVLTYASYGSEVDTFRIIRHCLKDGKRVYCPKVLEKGKMEFFYLSSLDELQEGYRGIPEPVGKDGGLKMETSNKDSVLIIVPLTVFDDKRNRIGYGGGFYDRYLQTAKGAAAIGLAFSCQRWQGILPMEPHDIQLDGIITEEKLYFTNI